MTKQTNPAPTLKFELRGDVGYLDDSGSDPSTWHGAKLDETFEANSVEEAIEASKGKIEAFLAKNKEYAPDPSDSSPKEDWEGCVKKYDFTLTQVVWEMKYRLPKAGRPAVPAVPPIEAGVDETLHI